MNILINLVSRIVSGERLEKGSRNNTAYWLSAFTLLPIWIFGSAALMGYLDFQLNGFITDTAWCLILFSILICLPLLVCIGSVARFFVRRPIVLLLIGIASWIVTAWYVTTRLI
jgi:hypothetical protein